MTLAIVFKGAEGVVLAADSRVTLQVQTNLGGQLALVPAHFDNATKLLKVQGQDHVAAVTYGLGTVGLVEPRTAHSFLPEFEAVLAAKNKGSVKPKRLTVEAFAKELSDFFLAQHKAANMPPTEDMIFLVGGYDEGAPYGRTFEVRIPTAPKPVEHNISLFGLRWGGQHEITSRILNSIDGAVLETLKTRFNLTDQQRGQLENDLQAKHALQIPYQFLPLQDCVDLVILLIETTAQLMRYTIGVRGVGGAIDVATITRTEGYQPMQVKQVKGKSV